MAVITEVPVVGGVTDSTAKINCRTDVSGNVQVEYAMNKNFNNSTTTSAVTSSSSDDLTLTFELNNLIADTMYWYRVVVDGVVQTTPHIHKFKTFPSGSATFKFAVFADTAPQDKVALCFNSAKNDGALFALQIGDFDHRSPATLADMRQLHRDMRDTNLSHGNDFVQQIASKMCVCHVFDDHDYGGNDSDKTFAGKADAIKAFNEYWPNHNGPNNAGIWHSFVCGDAEFFMLDTRTQRDPDTDVDDANKSMLDGDNITDGQKDWLKNGLLNSTATWKFVISTVTANLSARPQNIDHWKSFSTERDEIKDYIANNNIDNVIMLTGDLHTGGAIDDGTNNGFGLPELCVAHTNLNKGNNNQLGTWSEGVTAGKNGNGYGLITVSANSVIIEAKAENGVVRHSLTL
jgi:alkaline phosphatase D